MAPSRVGPPNQLGFQDFVDPLIALDAHLSFSVLGTARWFIHFKSYADEFPTRRRTSSNRKLNESIHQSVQYLVGSCACVLRPSAAGRWGPCTYLDSAVALKTSVNF